MKAIKRTDTARETRRNKMIPAVIYGEGIENINISLEEYNIHKHLMNTEITLDGKSYTIMSHETQLHPVSDDIIHIDFICKEKS